MMSKSFKGGQTEAENMPHARQLRTSLNQVNAEQSDSLIQENHCINVRELAKTVGISVIGVQTIDN
jgi:hypothetical protein